MIVKTGSELTRSELDNLVKIDQAYFPFPWSLASWEGILVSDDYLVIFDEQYHCFALFLMSTLEELGHLLKVLVVPECRGQKLGLKLLKQCNLELSNRQLTNGYLEVEETNLHAIKLYEELGAKRIHVAKGFYSNGENAVIMTWPTAE